ncbi:Glycogen [starch] synthase [Meloidogyne graminicola]|uniref:Glycogen [starch] synthase n=1 Tax=Meloidogyne graminicola TaxID=189291 RepID=A0A8S9ZTV7_9BILA|nr:Glycogen [starch] synthase [Meloidogyne graminicola]
MIYLIVFISLLHFSETSRPSSAIFDARKRINSICRIEKYDTETEEKRGLCNDGVEIGGGAAETLCRRSIIRANGFLRCEVLLFNASLIQKGCIDALSTGLNFPGKGWCLLLNEECCKQHSKNVVNTITPFCFNFAKGVNDFTQGTCRWARNVAIAGANAGCSESIKEAKGLALNKCYDVLGINSN